MLRSEDNLVQS